MGKSSMGHLHHGYVSHNQRAPGPLWPRSANQGAVSSKVGRLHRHALLGQQRDHLRRKKKNWRFFHSRKDFMDFMGYYIDDVAMILRIFHDM